MNKKQAVSLLALALVFSGCSGAKAGISDADANIMTVGDITYTRGQEYDFMKLSAGPNLVMQMVEGDIYDKEIGRGEDILKEAEDSWNEYAKTTEDLEAYVQSLGYTGKDQYVNDVLVPGIQSDRLLTKWFDDDKDAIIQKYKPSKAQIIQAADEEAAKSALQELKDGKTPAEVAEAYGVAGSAYTGESQLVTTLDTGLPTRMINSLAAAKQPGVLDEIFNQDQGAYYLAVLNTNTYDDVKEELISTLKNDSTVAEECLVFYLKKYDFQVYDQDIFDYLKNNYPQYLVSRPDLAENTGE